MIYDHLLWNIVTVIAIIKITDLVEPLSTVAPPKYCLTQLCTYIKTCLKQDMIIL